MKTLALISSLLGLSLTLHPLIAAEASSKPDVDRNIRYQHLPKKPTPANSPQPRRERLKSALRQILDVHYKKSEVAKKKPVVLWVHGGAWKFGNKTHSIGPKANAFVNKGYILVAMNYRFHPDACWHEQASDVAAATKWITKNISRYGGDPKRIAIMGHSAGAHLAAITGANPSYLQSAGVPVNHIQAVVLLDGAGYDLPAVMKTSQGQHLQLYQEVFGKDPKKLKAASPIYHFKKGQPSPDYLIIPISSREITITQSKKLASAIKTSGNHAEIFIAKNRSHMSLNQKIGNPGDAPTKMIFSFLEQRMKAATPKSPEKR